MRHPGGRPSKLTPETKEKLFRALATGAHRSTACDYAGIHYSTFMKWMALGQEKPKTKNEYREFFNAVKQLEAELQVSMVEDWRSEAKKNWQGTASFLARRFPKKWAEQIAITIEEEQLDFWQRLKNALDPAIFRTVLEQYVASYREDVADGDGDATRRRDTRKRLC